ncbi:short chain enoyl-CoA hydratase [Kytococcus aerolatus]|uniref:enoyl-CoA hydratase n=1 Tax=Kytococcus aerolatus TaxID=592308 RepID=A0A212TZU9_9MICO|nr:enoyl-CoA hydratase-related protein [Kytococcus aerolatus]SNC71430.1 short chain enoyl-CoA hydratase [Kytococcus aerolatus]
MSAPTPSPESWVRIEWHGQEHEVAELVLARTEAMNAISTEMARQIAAATTELAASPARCVVVTSAHEKAFCVGADLKERNSFTDADLMEQRPVTQGAYGGVLDLPMPTIAAVDGFALGGGLEIALSCDVIVAGRGALLGLPEVSVGVIPGGGGTQLLTRRIGWSRAARAIFTASKYEAPEAHELGIVDELVDAGSAREAALEMAGLVGRHSPVGLRNAKRAMRLGSDVDLRTGLQVEDACWRATAFSGDRAEGVAAFAEKRAPKWPGK